MLILYFLNLAVIANSILIIKTFYSKQRIEDKLLAAFTVYLAQIILFVLLLGITGIFTLYNLIVLTISFSLIVLFLFGGKKNSSFFPYFYFVREVFLWILQYKLLAVSFSFLFGFSLVKIFHNLVTPPFLWDNLIYHYTFPVQWFKGANLANPIVFTCPGLSYIAMNGEFFFLWLMAPLKNVFIADIANYPFYIMGVIASFGIMRKLGVCKEIALLSGILFSLTPQYFKDLLFNANDLMIAPLFLIALNFILLLKEQLSFRNVIIAGISLGILWGTKSTAMIWAPLLALMVIYFMMKNYKNIGFSNLVLFSMIFIMFVLIFGGFTYIRNFIETGNPLYPVNYKLLGISLKGPIEFSEIYDGINLLNIDLEEILFHQSFGLHFILLAFPALFVSLPLLFIKSKFRLSFDIAYLLFLPLIMIVSFYAKCPTHTPSYLYHIIALGTIIGVYVLDRLGLPNKIIKGILFIMIIAAVAELAGHMMLFYSLLLSGLIFAGLILIKNERMYRFYRIFSITVLFILLGGLIPLEDYYGKTEHKRYADTIHWEKNLAKGWEWIYEYTLHNPKNITYTGSSAILPLYGRDFANNVYYTSINDKEPVLTNFSKAYEFRDPRKWVRLMRQDGALRERADFDTWLENLYRKNTDLLFIMSLDFATFFPIEDEWAKARPDIFKPMLSNERVHIYKILKLVMG